MPIERSRPTVTFRSWHEEDRDACLSIFDANCPDFFAPNERSEYISFLDSEPNGYEVCEMAGHVVGACGLVEHGDNGTSLNWIMIDPGSQGSGIGSAMMERVVALARATGWSTICIAASHKSAAFFERFGAVERTRTRDGWGPGMDRVDMELRL